MSLADEDEPEDAVSDVDEAPKSKKKKKAKKSNRESRSSKRQRPIREVSVLTAGSKLSLLQRASNLKLQHQEVLFPVKFKGTILIAQ